MKKRLQKMKNRYVGIFLVLTVMCCTACMDHFLPDSLDAFDKEAAFSITAYEPVLGRTTTFTNNFNSGNSTLPLTFRIENMVHADGTPAPELTEYFPVRVWTSPYLGTETSLAEIEAKRTYENRQLFQVREHSGEFVMWDGGNSSFIRCQPDNGYTFDVVAENSGGEKRFTGFQLKPKREMDYEPNQADEETGFITNDYVNPSSVENMYIEGKSGYFGLMGIEDVQVYFRQNNELTSEEKTLTFRFLDDKFQPISPERFSTTNWEKLVHGFDMEKTNEYVRYKVAYPIPLSPTPTEYTNSTGDMAHVKFGYDRINSYGRRISASLAFDFAIYKEGHWEIVFVFAKGTPEFRDNY